MPTSHLSEHPVLSVHDSLTTSKALNRTSYHNSLDNRKPQDVFGPVMHNESKPTVHAGELKKDIGAIGDRRKKDDVYNGIVAGGDASGACSTVSL